VTVYGISLDDVSALADFAKEQKLNFSLLSDPDGSAATKYGALMPNGHYASRITFIIDPSGVIRQIDSKVNVLSHGTDLAQLIHKLKG